MLGAMFNTPANQLSLKRGAVGCILGDCVKHGLEWIGLEWNKRYEELQGSLN